MAWICPSSIFGQHDPVSVLTVNNGLSGGYIQCAVINERGLLWIGGSNGISRYDGQHVVQYTPDPNDPNALQSLQIYQLSVDARQHLFILGDRGLEVFLPEQNRFVLLQAGMTGNPVFANFWMDEDLHTGFVSELVQGDIIPFDLDKLTVYADRQHTPADILKFIDGLWHQRTLNGNQHKDARFVKDAQAFNIDKYAASTGQLQSLDKEDRSIWTGYRNAGFYRFIYGNPAPEWVALKGLEEDVPPSTRMFFYNYNNTLGLVFAEGFGVISFQKHTGQVIRTWDLRREPSLGRWTSGKILCQDAAGRVWLTIMPYGLFVLDPLSPESQCLKSDQPNSLLYNGLLRSMSCDTAGHLWLGFHDGTIQVLDAKCEKEIYRFGLSSGNIARTQSAVVSLHLDPWGHMVANQQEIFEYSGNAITAQKSRTQFYPYPGAKVYNEPGQPERLVIVTDTVGPVTHLRLNTKNQNRDYVLNLGYNIVPALFVAQPQMLLMVYGETIITADMGQGDTIEPVQLAGLYNIKGMHQAPGSDTVWICTANGLFVFNARTRNISRIDTETWPSQVLYGIVPDDQGRFWISSNGGLIRYEPGTGRWKRFDVHDGLQSNEFNTNCFTKCKDGRLAFGGPEGINVFDPAYFEDRHVPFYVYGTSVRVQDTLIAGFNPLATEFSFSMRPKERSVELEYSSTLMFDREDIRYQVQLVGADHDWVDMGNKEVARYINLNPGPYVFRLRASNADGQWSENIFETQLRVIPAFYQTYWFVVLCSLLSLSIVYAFYRYRIRQLRKLEAVRNRISHDLHDDVGSTLGSISIYSEVAKQMDAGSQPEVLDKIGEASREMIDKLNDIVWSINPENDTFEKLESRMRGYATMVLQAAGIGFEFHTDPGLRDISLDMDDRRNLFLMFKEAIYNAAKYAQCSTVHIELKKEDRKLSLIISDNGIGFDPDAVQAYNGNGLRSMRERAQAMKGELLIKSQKGKGTSLHLKVPF